MTTTTQTTTIQKLIKWVNQRPGLDFANYGDVTSYRAESREITADRNDFFELLAFAQIAVPELEQKLTDKLKNDSGRLTIDSEGRLNYCTGQYFPTEYRPAASRILSSIIWNELRKEYETGDQIRKAARRNVSRRVAKHYFN